MIGKDELKKERRHLSASREARARCSRIRYYTKPLPTNLSFSNNYDERRYVLASGELPSLMAGTRPCNLTAHLEAWNFQAMQ